MIHFADGPVLRTEISTSAVALIFTVLAVLVIAVGLGGIFRRRELGESLYVLGFGIFFLWSALFNAAQIDGIGRLLNGFGIYDIPSEVEFSFVLIAAALLSVGAALDWMRGRAKRAAAKAASEKDGGALLGG